MADTAIVKIYDAGNVQVRTLRIKADSGFNRFYWGLEGKGVQQQTGGGGRRGGGRGSNRSGDAELGGLPVDPGTYKVVLSVGKDLSDSMLVVVNDDPKAPVSKEVRTAIRKANTRLDTSSLKLVKLTDRLMEADDIVKRLKQALKIWTQKQVDTLRKTGKAMQDSIKAIREQITGKLQEKQGYGNVPPGNC